MRIYLRLDESANKERLLKKISRFDGITQIYDSKSNIIVHTKEQIQSDHNIRQLEKKYKLLGVKDVVIGILKNTPTKDIRHKNFHCFFDIDNTLTKGNGVINKNIRTTFDNMKNNNMRIYFVSGRSVPQILKDMNEFKTEPYSIAENGGILVGIGDKGEMVFGDRAQPDVLDMYIKLKHPDIKEDIDQGFRKTERIYLQTVSRKTFNGYVRKSKSKVSVQESTNSYHVGKKGVDKGSAVEKLTCDLRFGPNDIIIAVGDADMDVPMLKIARLGFAVGNASPNALKSADIQLVHEHDKGIAEMYDFLLRLK